MTRTPFYGAIGPVRVIRLWKSKDFSGNRVYCRWLADMHKESRGWKLTMKLAHAHHLQNELWGR